jgi:hypothetical protein
MSNMLRVMFPFFVVALMVACSAETGAAPTPTAAVSVNATASAEGDPGDDGILLIWHRSGGIAGFCDVLTASTSGELQAGTCNAEPRVLRLTDAERLQLQTWAAQFGQVVLAIGDPAGADALFTSLEMNGLGVGQPTEAEQQQMLDWAQALYGRAATP